jgi:F5/8 type C domain
MQAVLLSTSREAKPSVATTEPEAAWQAVNSVVDDWAPLAPADVECVREVLVARDLLALDRLSPQEALRRSAAFRAALQRLFRFIEPRSPRRIKRERLARQAIAALLACALLVTLVVRWARPANLALHRPVQSTPTAYQTTAEGAVDGEKNGAFGFHSQDVDSPQLTIDLEKPRHIVEVKVFGRGDCCFDQSVPLVLEVSSDGTSFRQLSERTSPFSESDPWIVETGAPENARFVRLRGKHHGVLVLSEVEVYGKRWN